jgi:chorismate dehydratase
MWDFEHDLVGPGFEVSYTLPSQCAEDLRGGSADIGIIPVAAYASVPGLSILPGIAIASLKSVRSILLVSKRPLEQIRTVALDTSSMTSVALTKVLFEKWLGGGRIYTSTPPDIEAMLKEHDAGLLIGDPALRIDRSRYGTFDLAEEWNRFTGKPFVFAFWAVRAAALEETSAHSGADLISIFQRSRDHGTTSESVNEIAQLWAPRLGMSEDSARSYLTENIHYSLEEECLEGLRLFYRYAEECGALPRSRSLRFFEQDDPN